MANTVDLVVAVRQGLSLETVVAEREQELQRDLDAKANALVGNLLARQAQINAAMDEMMDGFKQMDIHQASSEQAEKLAAFKEKVSRMQADLKQKLNDCQSAINDQKAKQAISETALRDLTVKVRDALVGQIHLPPPPNPNASVDERMQQLHAGLNEKGEKIADELGDRKDQIKKVVDELLDEMARMDTHEASRKQLQNLKDHLAQLKGTRESLNTALDDAEARLKQRTAQACQLEAILREFKKQLKNTPIGVSQLEAELGKIPQEAKDSMSNQILDRIFN